MRPPPSAHAGEPWAAPAPTTAALDETPTELPTIEAVLRRLIDTVDNDPFIRAAGFAADHVATAWRRLRNLAPMPA